MISEDLSLIGTSLNISSLWLKLHMSRTEFFNFLTFPTLPVTSLLFSRGTITASASSKHNLQVLYTRLDIKSCRFFVGNTETQTLLSTDM